MSKHHLLRLKKELIILLLHDFASISGTISEKDRETGRSMADTQHEV
jgi:hypothetical protein